MTVDEALMSSGQWLSKSAVAIGGFLIFAGIIITGVSVLVLFGFVEISILENEKLRVLSLWALLAIGVLDLVAGILLRHR